jgi:hypothetical protein
VSNDVKFVVDKPHNQFLFTMPADALTKIQTASAKGPMIGPGTKITGLAITTRRSEAASFVPNADEAAGQCPFVVPRHGSLAARTIPAFLPPAAIAARAGRLRDELPAAALAALLVAAVVAGAGRRRRWPASVA